MRVKGGKWKQCRQKMVKNPTQASQDSVNSATMVICPHLKDLFHLPFHTLAVHCIHNSLWMVVITLSAIQYCIIFKLHKPRDTL